MRYVLCLRSDLVQEVAQLDFLCSQIANVRVLRRNLDRHALDDPEPVPLHPDDLPGIVRDEPDLLQPKLDQDLRAHPLDPKFRLEAQGKVALERVLALVLYIDRARPDHKSYATP